MEKLIVDGDEFVCIFYHGSNANFYRTADGRRVVKLRPLTNFQFIAENQRNELKIYKALSGHKGIARVVPREVTQTDFSCLEFERLGPSLRELLLACDGAFSLKTTLLLFL